MSGLSLYSKDDIINDKADEASAGINDATVDNTCFTFAKYI